MKNLITATLITLLFVGVTIADYDGNDQDRNGVLDVLAERSAMNDQSGKGNGFVEATAAGRSTRFSEYYQLDTELLY